MANPVKLSPALQPPVGRGLGHRAGSAEALGHPHGPEDLSSQEPWFLFPGVTGVAVFGRGHLLFLAFWLGSQPNSAPRPSLPYRIRLLLKSSSLLWKICIPAHCFTLSNAKEAQAGGNVTDASQGWFPPTLPPQPLTLAPLFTPTPTPNCVSSVFPLRTSQLGLLSPWPRTLKLAK